MRKGVRVAALLLLLLLLLGSLFTAALFSLGSQPVPGGARSRHIPSTDARVGSLSSSALPAHNLTCFVRTVDGPMPPPGATCRFAFAKQPGLSALDRTFPLTTVNGTMLAFPEGSIGNLTGTASGYWPQSRDVGVWEDTNITFWLRPLTEPGPGATPDHPMPVPPPPAPPAPPIGPGGQSTPPSQEPRPDLTGDSGSPGGGPPAAPQCSDLMDNDGDGFTDYPDDPGCTDAADNDETDPPPPPPPPAIRFGTAGVPVWDQYISGSGAGEPTIGISWKGADFDHPRVMMQFNTLTFRNDFGGYNPPGAYNPKGNFPTDASGNELAPGAAGWTDTNNPHSLQNVDPLLWTDRYTGRTFGGGLDGWNSIFGVSDDDGATWQPSPSIAASGTGWDHQGMGSGPYASPAPVAPPPSYPAVGPKVAFYYCSQSGAGTMACSRSDDGGTSWSPTTNQGFGGCGGLHGHPLVSQVDGSVYVPARNCGGVPAQNGMAMSIDNGLNWDLRTVPGSAYAQGFDPDLGISVPDASISPPSVGNWMYYAQGDNSGAHVALSIDADRLDLGTIPLGAGNGVNGGAGDGWLDLGALASPPVVRAVFPDVQVGDDRRAAVSFLGSTQPFDHDACNSSQKWDYYVAITYDGGTTWRVDKVSPDPVQSGGVWSQGGSSACRNLLDFNDMQSDAHGRLYIGFGDGCIPNSCTAATSMQGSTNTGAMLRMRTGCGLFHTFDEPGVSSDCN